MKNKQFWIAAVHRAARTFCQAAIGSIGAATLVEEVNWIQVLSCGFLAAILSLLTSVATGLPEAKE